MESGCEKMRRQGVIYSTLGSLGCFIIFCVVFLPHDDPYFIFNSVVNFVSDFSVLSARIGEFFKDYLLRNEKETNAFAKIIDSIFTYDYLNFENIFEFIKSRMDSFVSGK